MFLIKGAKKPVSELHDAFQSNTSLAPKKHENFRPIINFKRLNKLIPYHFKIQGLMQRSLPKQQSQDKTGSEGYIFQFWLHVETRKISDILRDLVTPVQFKKCKKHLWRSVTFSRAAGFTRSNTTPWMFFTFLNCTNGSKSRKGSHMSGFYGWRPFKNSYVYVLLWVDPQGFLQNY